MTENVRAQRRAFVSGPGDHVSLDVAVEAVADVLPAVTRLIRSARDPDARAVGDWSVGDVAAHLSHVTMLELDGARERGDVAFRSLGISDPHDLSEVGAINEAMLERDRVRDLGTLASRIDETGAELVEFCRSAAKDAIVPWLLQTRLPLSSLCSHLVFEMALHGHDIAKGAGLAWRIDPAHACQALEGFLLPVIAQLGSRFAPDAGRGSCEMRLRGGSRFVFATTGDGLVVERPGRKADLHISADPVTMLLVMSGRSGRLVPAFRGRMLAWGRHPLRAMRLLNGLQTP